MSLSFRHLRLRNVRSYEAAEVELGPGVTVLTGDVGSGKTSLLHAVEMALFGFAEVEAPYLVRHGAGEASVELTLADEEHTYALGRAFRRRTRRGREVFDPEEPTFRLDGTLRRYSATEFRQRVIELVGFPDNPNPRSRSDLWRWAIYTPQERMREILRLEEADARLETIRKALGLERYRRAADNAELVAAGVRGEARSHTDIATGLGHFERDLADADAAIGAARTALSEREAAAAEARRQRAQVDELLDASERARRLRDAERTECDRLAREIPRARTLRDAARRSVLDAVRERERRAQELARAEAEHGAHEAARVALGAAEAAQRERTVALSALDAAARELAVAESQRGSSDEALALAMRAELDAGQGLTRAESAAAEADARRPLREPAAPTPRSVEEIGAALERLRSVEREQLPRWSAQKAEAEEVASLLALGVCPRCHQAVAPAEFESHRQEAEAALTDTAAALERTRAEVAALETERGSRERYDRAFLAWTAREDARLAAGAILAEARTRVAGAQTAREAAQARVEAARAAVALARTAAAPRDERVRSLRQAESELAEAREAWTRAERAAAAEAGLREALTSAESHRVSEAQRVDEAERALLDLEQRFADLEGRVRAHLEAERAHSELVARRDAVRSEEVRASSDLSGVRERLALAEARRAEVERGVSERRLHVEAAERLQNGAAFLAGPFHDALVELERRRLGRAQAAFERSFARAFSALVEDPGLVARCSPSFVPYVEIDGTWTPAEALSGGERTALALAFRLALGDLVRATSPLRLDAIVLDEPTDGFSPEQVARMGELLRALPWHQVLIVTHEAGLSAIADRTVRVRKVEGASVLSGDGVPTSGAEPPRARRRRSAEPPGPLPATS